jgi:hypothetical protein
VSTENKRLVAAADVIDTHTPNGGSVILRGVNTALDSDVGEAFIADCARHMEGLMSDLEIKTKYELSDEDWQQLASNTSLLHAVRAERDRRIHNGCAAREAAQWFFAKAPAILGQLLSDNLVSPRHRIEAARELRQAAGSGPNTGPGPDDKVVITIDLGGDEKLVYEKQLAPVGPLPTGGEKQDE